MKYQLSDSLSVYTDSTGLLAIASGRSGQLCSMRYSEELVALLHRLQEPTDLDSLFAAFPQLTPLSIRKAIRRFISLRIVEECSTDVRDIRCMIIGCGSLGSHIFRQISMLNLEKIFLVDTDKVDQSNIYRQDYYAGDLGLFKTQVLSSRPYSNNSVVPLDCFIKNSADLENLLRDNDINLVIQAADTPTTDDIARMINQACDTCSVPYIVNPGYLGNAVSLPEFYYPNSGYSYMSSHQTMPGRLLFRFQKSKINYRLCSMIACLVAQQVEDYQHHRIPIHYGEKGHLNCDDYSWHTECILTQRRDARSSDMELTAH